MAADIFISYSRVDRARIEKLAAALAAEGLSVWWDKDIAGGAEFTSETEARLNEAKAVLVAWSKASVASTWVCDEATVGREKGCLVPIAIDTTAPRLGFRSFQTIDLANWHGDRAADEYQHLVRVLKARIAGEATPAPAPRAPPTLAARLRKQTVPLIAAAVAAVALIAAVIVMLRPQTNPAPASTAEASLAPATAREQGVGLAVIPFTNLSSDPEQEHFADGLTEEILNWLGNVEGLNVPGRTSSFQFKGKAEDLRAIGAALNVDYLLEGSVRRSGDALRITAQLIEAKSGYHLWSETYDRTLADLFAIQDELARRVVTELLGEIPETGAANPAAVGDVDPRAHELYLEGRALWTRRNEAAVSKFQAAVAVDNRHFLAQAYIAVIAAWAQANAVPLPGLEKSQMATADEALAAAVRLKPEAADVLFAQGWVADARGTEFMGPASPAAVDFYQRAVRANPRHVEALHALARGQMNIAPERSVELYERVLEIDPAHSAARGNLIAVYGEIGDRDKALATARQTLALGPGASRLPAAGAGWRLGDMALLGEGLFGDFEATERDAGARWFRAAVLADLGALEESRFLYAREAAVELPPWRQLARFNVAVLGRDAKAALSLAEEIHGVEPAPIFAAPALSAALIRIGEPQRAYDVLLERWPDLADGRIKDIPLGDLRDIDLLTAAHALRLAGRGDEARAVWQSALAVAEAEPAFTWEHHLERALIRGALEDRAAAVRDFKAAYDAGFRYLWTYNPLDHLDDGFYAESGLFKPLMAIPEIAAMVAKIEAENAKTLEDFNKKYGILDRVHEMMAAEAVSD